MFKALLYPNDFAISTTSRILCNLHFPFSHKFLTTTTTSNPNSPSFAVSYFINNLKFSSESALKASKLVHFKTSKKPDSVLSFFRTHGFTDSDIHKIIQREPWLLSCDTQKRVLPKFQFLLSKGASTSDVVRIVVGNPRFMKSSLNNRVIPIYNLVTQFLQSDQKTVASIISCPSLLCSDYLDTNINMMVENGVCYSSIYRILRTRPNVIFCRPRLVEETVKELKNMGFDPSKSYFGDALIGKIGLSKSKWNERIDTFKSWGWSEETILEAIKRQPQCMLVSNDKINRVMNFWVNEMGWDSSYLVKGPGMFGYCLEKRIIPRAMVIFYLIAKGLRSEKASLLSPFYASEKLFLERQVLHFTGIWNAFFWHPCHKQFQIDQLGHLKTYCIPYQIALDIVISMVEDKMKKNIQFVRCAKQMFGSSLSKPCIICRPQIFMETVTDLQIWSALVLCLDRQSL